MVEYAKRSEVTIETMGRVHNPTGEGVRAVSTQVQAKAAKHAAAATSAGTDDKTADSTISVVTTTVGPSTTINGHVAAASDASAALETKTKEGTARRNIVRKKTSGSDSGNYNSNHKKQGGHGKGQWKDIDPSYVEEIPMDQKDPLYDDIEGNPKTYILSSAETACAGAIQKNNPRGVDPSTSQAVYGPMLTESEFKHQVLVALQEYFDSNDSEEFIRTLLELKCEEYAATVVKKAVSLALDKGPRERESVSRLLAVLHPTPLADADMEQGFAALLDSLDDLQTDVPEAHHMIACFLARAVVDEVLPPAFLSNENNNRPGCVVIEKAIGLLNREHSTARLERIWGPGDGRPVDELKAAITQLLQEYLLSRELDEAARCVKELDCAYFHHELVKRGVVIAMELEGPAESNLDAMAALFGFLLRNAIVSDHQVQKGLSRLHAALPDLTLDVPAAPQHLAAFETLLSQILNKDVAEE